METQEQKTNGALIGSFIIVIILILGGIYLWKVMLSKQAAPMDTNAVGSLNTEN